MTPTVRSDSYLTLHYRITTLDGEEFLSTFDMSPATLQMGSGQLAENLESVLIGLVSLHLAAIAWYALIRRRNLVRPMISGDAPAPPGAQGSRDDLLLRLGALLVAAACGAAAWFMLLR